MDKNNNPYLNGGAPINNSDLTKQPNNSKTSLMASMMTLKKLREISNNQMSNRISSMSEEVKSNEPVSQPISDNKVSYSSVLKTSPKPAENNNYNAFMMDDNPAGITSDMLTKENKTEAFGIESEGYITAKDYHMPNNDDVEAYDQPNNENNVSYEAPVAEKPKYVMSKEERHGITQKDIICSGEDIRKGKKVAWLAYILFFIPLLFAGKNPFVRFHANEGLETNLVDIVGIGCLLAGWLVKTNNTTLELVMAGLMIVGIIIIALTTITKIVMIILSLCGKAVQTPWFFKARMIK